MAHIIREEKAESISEIAIYAIPSPFDDSIYINKCTAHRLKSVYTEHYNLRNKKTTEIFKKAKSENIKPQMFLLQSLETSQRIAFRHCVAWAMKFRNQGYNLIANDVFESYINDPTKETQALFESLRDYSITEILSPDKNLFPNYGAARKKVGQTIPKTIHFYIKPHEYLKLKEAAEESGLSLAAYCKQKALRNKSVEIDLSFMSDYLNEFAEDKLLLRQILFAIHSRGSYFPADLQNIQNLVDHLTELQKKVQSDIKEVLKALRE